MPINTNQPSLAAFNIRDYLCDRLERKYHCQIEDVNTDIGRKDGRDVASLIAMLPSERPVLVKVVLGNRPDDDGLHRFHMGYDAFNDCIGEQTSHLEMVVPDAEDIEAILGDPNNENLPLTDKYHRAQLNKLLRMVNGHVAAASSARQ